MKTGEVLGKYRYACVGRSARRVPFYPEGRRRPTMEERKAGTDFPLCQGLEILVAERAAASDATTDRRGTRGERANAGRSGNGSMATGERYEGERGGGSEVLSRVNASAGKIARNMARHASFIADGAYALFVGGRR